jgi:hypothetical protein
MIILAINPQRRLIHHTGNLDILYGYAGQIGHRDLGFIRSTRGFSCENVV